MFFEPNAATSYAIASLLCVLLAGFFFKPWRGGIYSVLFIPATLVTAIWQLSLVQGAPFQNQLALVQFFSTTHYALWITALLATLVLNISDSRARSNTAPLYAPLALLVSLGGMVLPWLLTHKEPQQLFLALAWCNLLLALLGIIVVEQVFRNTLTRQKQAVTFLCLGSSLFFIYDLFLYSHALIFNAVDQNIWEARAATHIIAVLVVIFATTRTKQSSTISISRNIVFYSASLVAAGLFLFVMAAGGYYVRLYGGSWGTLLQVTLMSAAGISTAVALSSAKLRASLRVFINKHFFLHKYDYRVEWLNLINVLSQDTSNKDASTIALHAVADIFNSPAASLWLRENDRITLAAAHNMTFANDPSVMIDTPFCALLTADWVFSPTGRIAVDRKNNRFLPAWLTTHDELWIVMPLIAKQELCGFIALLKPRNKTSLTWEDLDVMKTVGRQLGSYLALHQAAELLAQSKQFDTYNKLTAFVMHDLKNLIAQQGLVVENATKHKENPAFVEDAIKTIENSVARMNNLLNKLQQKDPVTTKNVELNKILIESINKCRGKRPNPSLRINDKDVWVNGDHDHLVMIFAHIIKNAQEATPTDGFVDVYLNKNGANAVIQVEDNGHGMEESFIKERLFRPFDTTKSGQGMGIGVFQTREYIHGLDGEVTVDSSVGGGTNFSISLPLVER